ncbi:DNA sulfur modification protein DndB [Pseudoalteromonas ruthenica]|nr:DNA sulfur modification protein DndB [Pseudoalteromonas ruthenica]
MNEDIGFEETYEVELELTKTVKGTLGSFHTKDSYPVNYLLTAMNHRDLECLEVAAEAFDFEQVNFEEMVQREIDVKRVNKEIVAQYLEKGTNNALFFPPIIVSVVGFDEEEMPLHKYENCTECSDEVVTGKNSFFYKTWDRHFQIEVPRVKSGFDFYSSDNYGDIQIYKHAAKLNFDPNLVKFVVIDGQHRFKAIQEYLRRYPEQKKFLNIPVCICFSPKAIENNGPEDILDTLRNMFVTINNTGKKVSGHYIDLLNDSSLASQTVRTLANHWKKQTDDPTESKLQFLEWNQRSDSKARRVNRSYSITTVSMLCEALKQTVFLNDKEHTNLHNILNLYEMKERLEVEGDSIYAINEDSFSHYQKGILYDLIKERLIEPLEKLLTKPSVYEEKMSSYYAALEICKRKARNSDAGYPTFITELSKFSDVDRDLHDEQSVSASKYFSSLISDNEHLENYNRIVFIQAYLNCWTKIIDCHPVFRADLNDFTEVFVKSLEPLAFNKNKMIFSKSRLFNQLTLYKNNKPNTTKFGKECWSDLLITTFMNSEQKDQIHAWLAKKPGTEEAKNRFNSIIENAKCSFVDKMRQEVLKDNLKNWRSKDFPLGFRRELEDLETSGKQNEIGKKLEKESQSQIDARIEILSNIIGVTPTILLERKVES